MAKPQKFFRCCNDQCRGWLMGTTRLTIADCAQELNGKRLCKLCFDAGFRLKVEVVARRMLINLKEKSEI